MYFHLTAAHMSLSHITGRASGQLEMEWEYNEDMIVDLRVIWTCWS